VEISRAGDGRLLFTPGIFAGTGPAECGGFRYREVHASLPLHAGVLGGGLFDSDGGLLAVVGRCGERYSAIATEDVDAAVRRAGAVPARILQRYGMRTAALDAASRGYFRVQDGALITETWKGRLADWVGLAPGDIITGLDGIAVRSPNDLERLLVPLPGGFFGLEVRRAAGISQVSLPASESLVRAARPPNGLGVLLQAPGYVAESVEPGSRAYRAGMRAGDRLLQIGPRRVSTLTAARRLLSRPLSEPIYLVVERGDRTIGLLAE
jgi:S1-C subfamily serine protease